MGKTINRKSKARRHCPLGFSSVEDLENEELLESKSFATNTVDSIIEKLRSSIGDERECAACTIANMADHPLFVKCLLNYNAIKIAAPLLVDQNVAVRHAVAGALRNLSVCGGHEVCQAMVAQDIMPHLVALFNQYKASWAPAKSEERIDSQTEVFVEACNLLCNLCESSNDALSVFNDAKILSILLPCLDVNVFGLRIPLAVAQCLHIIAEDNPEVIRHLSQPSVLEQLTALFSTKSEKHGYTLLGVLGADILLSVYSGKIDDFPSCVLTSKLDMIKHTLNISVSSELQSLSEEVSSFKAEKKNKCREDLNIEQRISKIENTFKDVEHLLTAKQIALEILTNICFGGENEDWDDINSSDISDEMTMDAEDTPSSEIQFSLNVPCEVYGFIVNQQLLERVLSQIIILPEEVIKKLLLQNKQGEGCLKRLHSVRCGALLCINNLAQGLSIDDLGGSSKLFDIWMNVTNLAFKETDPSDTEQLEAATSCVRAVLRKIVEKNDFSLFHQISESDIAMMTSVYQKTGLASIKVNIIQAVATLGCLLGNSNDPNFFKIIQVIGLFLIESCVKNSELWVMAEAADAIMDVFAEDHLDVIAKEISLVERLNNFLPHLKAKIRQERKSLGEHLPIIMTAKINLVRFIKYKKAHS